MRKESLFSKEELELFRRYKNNHSFREIKKFDRLVDERSEDCISLAEMIRRPEQAYNLGIELGISDVLTQPSFTLSGGEYRDPSTLLDCTIKINPDLRMFGRNTPNQYARNIIRGYATVVATLKFSKN